MQAVSGAFCLSLFAGISQNDEDNAFRRRALSTPENQDRVPVVDTRSKC